MRESIETINQIPADFPDPSAKEFAKLPDEFNRGESKKKKTEKKPSSVRKVMLYVASAGAVTVGLITPVIKITPPNFDKPAVVETTETPSPSVITEATATPTPKPATPTPTPPPTPRRRSPKRRKHCSSTSFTISWAGVRSAAP